MSFDSCSERVRQQWCSRKSEKRVGILSRVVVNHAAFFLFIYLVVYFSSDNRHSIVHVLADSTAPRRQVKSYDVRFLFAPITEIRIDWDLQPYLSKSCQLRLQVATLP